MTTKTFVVQGASAMGSAGQPLSCDATGLPTFSGMLIPSIARLAADTMPTGPTNFQSILTLAVSGFTQYLVVASYVGLTNGAAVTPIIGVGVDGVVDASSQRFGATDNFGVGSACGASIQTIITTTTAAHSLNLLATWGSGSYTIHASTNPTQEGAYIIATPIAP